MQKIEVTRVSPLTGKTNVRILEICRENYRQWELRNMACQDAFPHLSAGDREFLISGSTEEDWEAMFQQEDDTYAPLSQVSAEDLEPNAEPNETPCRMTQGELAKLKAGSIMALRDLRGEVGYTPEFTCDGCSYSPSCEYVYDLYNTYGDCLANK